MTEIQDLFEERVSKIDVTSEPPFLKFEISILIEDEKGKQRTELIENHVLMGGGLMSCESPF